MTVECRSDRRPRPKEAVFLNISPEHVLLFAEDGRRLR
jgi:hypothetical protein